MRVVSTLLLTVTFLTTCLFALATQDGAKKFDYQVRGPCRMRNMWL